MAAASLPDSTITLGNESVTMVVDSAAPTINNAYAYYVEEGKVRVCFDYTVGASGLKSASINDTPIQLTGGHAETTVQPDGQITSVSIQLTSNSGKTATRNVSVTQLLKLQATVWSANRNYESPDGNYYRAAYSGLQRQLVRRLTAAVR